MGNDNCNEYIINLTASSLSVTTTLAHTSQNAILVNDSTINYQGAGSISENVICYQASGINKVTQQNSVSVYPNPASNEFTIDTNTDDKLIIDLYDVNGKHVFNKTAYGKSTIEVSNLNTGVYTVTIKMIGRVLNKKLAIVK